MRAVHCGGLLAAMVAAHVPAAAADPAGDAAERARAKTLYQSAEREMAAAQYVDAARDYGAAYGITKDAVLFFKIGSADEKAGKCPVAVVYYRRYLKEAQPEPKYVELTKERIRACGGTVAAAETESEQSQSQSQFKAETLTSTSTATATATSSPTPHHAAAWLVAGGALALALGGAVLADAAVSSESDVRDLYVGLQNQTPIYDAATATRYEQLLAEGHRYQHLSWASFGLAAAATGVSAALFAREWEF